MKLANIRQILSHFTRWYFELLLRVGHWCKLAPFHVTKRFNGVTKIESFTKPYQWFLYYFIWSGFIAITVWHCYSGYNNLQVNGLNSSTAIYSIFIMIYVTAAMFSPSLAFCSSEAIALVNSSNGSQCRGLFTELKWEQDVLLQFIVVQMVPASILTQFGCCIVLPWLYPEAPWMLVSQLEWLLKYFPEVLRILAVFLIEFVNITLPMYFCLSSVNVFMIGFTAMKIAVRRLRSASKGTYAQTLQAGRELQIYSRLCNNWWRPFFLPGTSLVCFMYMLWPLYFTLTKYNSDLPVYIYAMYPMLFTVTLVASSICYSEMAYIYILSFQITKNLCTKTRTRSYKNYFEQPSQVVRPKTYHMVRILALNKRHVLMPMRPVRVEAGTFGHYIKLSAPVKLVSEVFTYLLLLLRLRELRLSE